MKRRLNLRLLIALLGVTTILGLGVHLLHAAQVKRATKALLAQSERAEQRGDLAKAEEYLGRYLIYEPEDVEGMVRYGRLLEEAGQTAENDRRALQVYEKALRLAGDRADIRRKMAVLAIEQGDFAVAQQNAEILLRSSPEDGELKYLLGRCAEGAGRLRDDARGPGAASLYEQSLRLDPTRIDSYIRLADLLRTKLEAPDRADQIMDALQEQDGLIAHNGRSAEAFLARARYRERFDVPGVDPAADVARALELAPDDADIILAASEVALRKGDPDAARDLLRRGEELHPDNDLIYRARADVEMQAGRPEEAVDALRRGVALQSKLENPSMDLSWALANLLIQVGKLDDALAMIEEMRRTRTRPELLGYLEARVLGAREQWAAAAKALGEVVPALEARPEFKGFAKQSLILLGQCHERLGNQEPRLQAYRRALAITIDEDSMRLDTIARLGLAAALAELNRIDEAMTEYRIVLPRDPGAGLLLARLQILQNLRRPAQDRRWQPVVQTLDATERGMGGPEEISKPTSAALAVLRAEVLAAQDQAGPARQQLERALEQSPDQVELWMALAALSGRDGKPEEILHVLDDAQRRLGDRIELRLARIEYWAQRGGDEAPEALAAIAEADETFDGEGRKRLRSALFSAYTRLGRAAEAERLIRQLAEDHPEDLDFRIVLFDQELREGDMAAAERVRDQIRKIEGDDGVLWRYARAVLLIQQARQGAADRSLLTQAREELRRVAERRPDWSRATLVLAEVEELSGNPEAAINAYLKAILEQGERNASGISRALQLLTERKRLVEASQIVQKLKEGRVPLSSGLAHMIAQVSLETGDPAQALEMARKIVPAESNHPGELIWLGQFQAAANEPELAEKSLRKAVELGRDSPETWLALVLHLNGEKRTEDAEAALKEAEQALPKEGSALVLALGHEAIGHPDRARDLYQQALQAKPDDIATLRAVANFHLRSRNLDEVRPLLDRIIAQGGTKPDAAWARRTLATITAAGGDLRQGPKALEILGLGLGTAPGQPPTDAAPEDLRTQAMILAIQPSRARRQQAIEILEGLVGRKLGTPADLHLLAQLHDAGGDWPKARGRYLEALNAEGRNANHLVDFIRALLRHDNPDEAGVYLSKLEQLAPDQPVTIELKARVLVARGKTDEAVALLSDLARADKRRLGAIASLLEDLDQVDAAEKMFGQFVETFRSEHPEVVLAMAGFLGRQGRTSEAIDLIEGAWATCRPEVVSNASVVILYGDKGDGAQHERVATRIEEAIRAHPDKNSIPFDLANVRSLQGRHAEAEKIYRALYEKNKTNGHPLNNLAWLLAQQDGKGAEALALAQQAIGLQGEVPDLLDTRAVAYLATGQPGPAIQDLENALAITPKNREMCFHLALAYQKAGRRADAAEAFRKAREELGLEAADLHPLERASYDQLRGELVRK